MTLIRSVSLTLAACLVAAPALAQAENPQVKDLIKQGQAIEVIDDQGREIRGKVGVVSLTTVSIASNGRMTEIPVDAIMQIARPNDGLGNGALIGLGTGALLGLLGTTIGMESEPGCTVGFGPCKGPRFTTATMLVLGGIGTGIGVAVDALIRHDRVIYKRGSRTRTRVTPVIAPRVRGVLVAVGW